MQAQCHARALPVSFDSWTEAPFMRSHQYSPQHLDADKAGDSGVLAGFVQMLQGNLGPGILTLPFVFTQAGVILTSCMLVLVRHLPFSL